MRRLYLQVYATLVVVLLLFGALVAAAWVALHDDDPWLGPGLAALAAAHLPPADAPAAEQQARLDTLSRRLDLDLALRDAEGREVAAAGEELPAPRQRAGNHWLHSRGRGAAAALHLPDGRWLVTRRRDSQPHHPLAFLSVLGLLALAVGVGVYPIARRITRRLETLRAGVEELGRGELGARVRVEGRDEVADLARSFNRAADRIEALVEAQRRVLAGASHELRSPLARIRMAVELLEADPARRQALAGDVAELDALIEELLDASRLHAAAPAHEGEELDLLGLLAEEAARTGAEVSGQPVLIRGDGRLLRRLVRNLLENAERHGRPPVRASVAPRPGGGARLEVTDAGPGIPEAERERVFEPFYRPAGAAETGHGSGLGLALVRQIARAHGGDARVGSAETSRSRFEVDLGEPRPGAPRDDRTQGTGAGPQGSQH